MSILKDMTAVILCGGLGTRLREETEFKPKPMVDVGGRPIIWHIMKLYRHYGVRNFVLCLGYRGEVIKDFFLNYQLRQADIAVHLATGDVETLTNGSTEAEDWRVVLAETGLNTQTGGRIKRALKYVKGDTFFVTYGDGVSDVDIRAVLDLHRQEGREATVTAVHPSSRFGELRIEDHTVHAFQEKPQVHEGWVNGGFMVFEKKAFDRISSDPSIPLETGLMEPLTQDKQLTVYQHPGFWQCMDTYREMQLLNELWVAEKAPWRVWS